MATCGSSPQPLLSGQSWHLEAEAVSSALGQEQEEVKVMELTFLATVTSIPYPPPHTHIRTQFHLAYLSLFRARAHGHSILTHFCLWLQRPGWGKWVVRLSPVSISHTSGSLLTPPLLQE